MRGHDEGAESAEFGGSIGTVADRTGLLLDGRLAGLSLDGGSVIVSGGRNYRELMHATDDVSARLDDLQFVVGEGPGLDAFDHRFPVLEGHLAGTAAATRWPGFAREATAAGAGAVFAFPLQVGALPFGVLTLHRVQAGGLEPADVVAALLMAEQIARLVLADSQLARSAAGGADRDLPCAHATVPAATGMIAVQMGVSIAQALAQLRAAAFTADLPIQFLAAEVVARRLSFGPHGH